MNEIVYVYLEERFKKDSGGNYYALISNESFWLRYLSVFNRVGIVARVEKIEPYESVDCLSLIKNPNIEFMEVPYYQGPLKFLASIFKIFWFISKITNVKCSHLLRLPSLVGGIAFIFLRMRGRKYGVELVGDPFDVFIKAKVGGRMSYLYGLIFTYLTKRACKFSSCLSYVSKTSMSTRYPAGPESFVTEYSSIDLLESDIVSSRTNSSYRPGFTYKIISVGSMDQEYKGFDILIRAVHIVRKSGYDVILNIIGDGAYRSHLMFLACSLGIANSIKFLGKIERSIIFSELDESNLFVLASRTEGLPRALIEAMARGVPCLGSNVGGIPDLIDKQYLFISEDYQELADLIIKVINDINVLDKMSGLNIKNVKKYSANYLNVRRYDFYSKLKNI